jgi:hypothetical protein
MINLSPPQPNQNHLLEIGTPMKKNKKSSTPTPTLKAIEKVGISMATTQERVCTTNDKPAISKP